MTEGLKLYYNGFSNLSLGVLGDGFHFLFDAFIVLCISYQGLLIGGGGFLAQCLRRGLSLFLPVSAMRQNTLRKMNRDLHAPVTMGDSTHPLFRNRKHILWYVLATTARQRNIGHEDRSRRYHQTRLGIGDVCNNCLSYSRAIPLTYLMAPHNRVISCETHAIKTTAIASPQPQLPF